MIKRVILALSLIVAGAVGLAGVSSQPALAQSCEQKGMILTIKPWYYGLTGGANCELQTPAGAAGMRTFVATIALNIAEALIQIAGFVAVGFVIYGGFLFLTSSGQPEKAAAARKTIINALVGAVVAGSAVLLVNLVARQGLGI